MIKKIIGMIHLGRIRGANTEQIKEVIKKAQYDLLQLEQGGIESACIINESDTPYTITISAQEKESFLEIAKEIKKKSHIELGVCVLYNDRKATLDIAHEIGAKFVRIDTFVDLVESDAGIIHPEADKIIEYQKQIGAQDILLLTDVQPKYKKMIEEKTLEESIKQAFEKGSNGVIITGNYSGDPVEISKIAHIENIASGIYIGSGITSENIESYRKYIDGAFIGTYFKTDQKVDGKKVKGFMEICRNLSSKR